MFFSNQFGRICVVSVRVPGFAEPPRRQRKPVVAALTSRSRNASHSASNHSSSTESHQACVTAIRAHAEELGDCASISTEDELPSGHDTDDRESVLSSDVPRADTQDNDPIMLLSLVAATDTPYPNPSTSTIPTAWTQIFAKARAFTELISAVPYDSV